jgi:hypothetical protein
MLLPCRQDLHQPHTHDERDSMHVWALRWPHAGRPGQQYIYTAPLLWVLLNSKAASRNLANFVESFRTCSNDMASTAVRLFQPVRTSAFFLVLSTVWTSTIVDAQAAKSFRLNPLTNFCSRWCEWRSLQVVSHVRSLRRQLHSLLTTRSKLICMNHRVAICCQKRLIIH